MKDCRWITHKNAGASDNASVLYVVNMETGELILLMEARAVQEIQKDKGSKRIRARRLSN